MKIDVLALYQKSLLGGIGGLVGWGLMTLLVRFSTETTVRLYLKDLITGALIGLAVGAFTGAWEGLLRDRQARRAAIGASVGAGLGSLGGMIGLVIGEFVFAVGGGGLFSRALGWALFGALLGSHEGVYKRMPQKTAFGAFGGLLGGLLGGSTYESLAGWFQAAGAGREMAIAAGGAVGLTLVGLFVGLMTGLVEDLLRSAWLQFTAGWLEGQTRTLDPRKPVTTIGSNELADICIRGDRSIAPNHAWILSREGQFVLEAIEGQVLLHRGADSITISSHRLATGDLIRIGSTRARFQTGAE